MQTAKEKILDLRIPVNNVGEFINAIQTSETGQDFMEALAAMRNPQLLLRFSDAMYRRQLIHREEIEMEFMGYIDAGVSPVLILEYVKEGWNHPNLEHLVQNIKFDEGFLGTPNLEKLEQDMINYIFGELKKYLFSTV